MNWVFFSLIGWGLYFWAAWDLGEQKKRYQRLLEQVAALPEDRRP